MFKIIKRHQDSDTYLRLTVGLRRLKSSRGRLLQDGGGPRLLERFSPVDNSTRTRQPHIVLKTKRHEIMAKVEAQEKMKIGCVFITFHLVLSQHRMHLWGLQTPQKQNLEDSWQPKHFLKGHSTQKLFLTPSYFHCFLDSPHKPYNQGDSLG